MASNEELDKTYLEMCYVLAKRSRAIRKKVACIIVKDNHIIAEGWNGTAYGRPNECEDRVYISGSTDPKYVPTYELKTKDEVIHGEANAICKLARSTISGKGASMYCTLSPCIRCAPLIVQSGIKKVIYSEEYRDTSGIDFLRSCKVQVFQIKI